MTPPMTVTMSLCWSWKNRLMRWAIDAGGRRGRSGQEIAASRSCVLKYVCNERRWAWIVESSQTKTVLSNPRAIEQPVPTQGALGQAQRNNVIPSESMTFWDRFQKPSAECVMRKLEEAK